MIIGRNDILPPPREYSGVELLRLRKEVSNRYDRRHVVKEKEKLIRVLSVVEKSFYQTLFSKNEYDYKSVYNIYLEDFQFNIEYIQKILKPKFFDVNEFYFTQLFKPEL